MYRVLFWFFFLRILCLVMVEEILNLKNSQYQFAILTLYASFSKHIYVCSYEDI